MEDGVQVHMELLLVDINDRADRVIFVCPTKTRDRVQVVGREYTVFHTDYHYQIPAETQATIYDMDDPKPYGGLGSSLTR